MIYQEILEIKKTEDKTISLVRSTIDGHFYIKKVLYHNDCPVLHHLKSIQHEGIVNIFHAKTENHTTYTIEEMINAPTLDEVLANRSLSTKEINDLFTSLCDTLTFLHDQPIPIIHRDIKPENIFYLRGKPILFDFDISRFYLQGQANDTHYLGTNGYAAPEQYGFSQSDVRSDIYSLGILLNQVLTQQFPWQTLPHEPYRSIVKKATDINAKNRFQSCIEFKKALKGHFHLGIIPIICMIFVGLLCLTIKDSEHAFHHPIFFTLTCLSLFQSPFILYGFKKKYSKRKLVLIYLIIFFSVFVIAVFLDDLYA